MNATAPLTVWHLRCSNYAGGPETTLLGWLRYADRTRYAPKVLFFHERRGLHVRSLALFREHGVPVELIPWGAVRNLPGAVTALVRRLRASRPCIVHTHDVRSDFVALLAGRITGTPVVVSNHAWHAIGLKRHLQEGARARWLKYADLVVNVSEETHRETVRRGTPAERSVALYSGLDLAPYRDLPSRDEVRAKLGIPLDAPVVSNVARMWPEKAIDTLIEAAGRLRGSFPGLQVLQVGDGALGEKLAAQVRAGGLGDCVRLMGFRTDYAEVMRASDVFALPSIGEGMPMVIYSAMALGLPIVASNVDGMHDTLVHEQNALLIRPGNVEDLTAGIARLLTDRALARRLGDAARLLMESRFSAEGAVRKLQDLYDNVAATDSRHAPR